jgi:hypothetical protein
MVMNLRTVLIAALIATFAAPSQSAKPSVPGVTDPQIAFVKTSNRGRQLMVANEDGSGATAIYSSTTFLRPEMGSNGTVYFWEGGQFKRIAVTGGGAQTLIDTGKPGIPASDLSPDGTSLAWFSADGGGIFRYDIATGQQQPVATASNVFDLSFDGSGANIVFNVQVSTYDYEFYIVPASGGGSSPYGLTGRYFTFDASHIGSTLVISVHPAGGAPYLAAWAPGLSAPVKIADGYNPSYRCDDSAIVYQRVVGGGSMIFRRSSAGAITTIAKQETVFPSYKQPC